MSNSDPPVPQGLVAGKYRLTRLLGRGGMGAVWEGTHNSLGTRVAVKFIDAEYAESPEARSRFENEARAAAKLRSKHVVEVYDHGVSEDGRPFIVMEYLQGEPLDKRLDRVGRLPAKETALIMMQVCRALTKAHAAGVVHRDLKPENVFLVWDDEEGTDVVKVVDFGIAKFTDSALGASSSSTRTGSVLGTPHYMSPEQARGLRSVDYRSDLWSVAVIAYRCIVGQLPFDGEAVGDLLVKLCTAPIPVPSQLAPDIPPSFDAWLVRALNRDPAARFISAAQLAESLAAVCGLSLRGQFSSNDLHSGAYSLNSGARAVFGAEQSGGFETVQAGSSTGAPTTKTASGHTPVQRTGTGAVIAAVLATVVVLGIGGAILVKKLSATPTATAALPKPTLTSPPAAPPLVAVPNAVPEQPVAPLAASVAAAAPIAVVAPAPALKPVVPHPVWNKPPAQKPPAAKQNDRDIGF
ncbi:MAG: serine/threonine-protein kinase [Polyangiaceae bacterium]